MSVFREMSNLADSKVRDLPLSRVIEPVTMQAAETLNAPAVMAATPTPRDVSVPLPTVLHTPVFIVPFGFNVKLQLVAISLH